MTVDLQLINFPGAPNLPIFIAQEKGFFEEDNDFLDRKQYKNDLESYCYNMRSELDSYGKYEKYLEPKAKENFL